MSNVVSLTNVTKTFRQKTAVDQIDFSIKKGEIVAILGPNGSRENNNDFNDIGAVKTDGWQHHIIRFHAA